MSNRRDLKSYIRYDGSGRVIPGSNILNRFKPGVGNWKEINTYECCNPLPLPSNCIEFVVDTTEGTFFGFSFTTTGPINFTVDWGDGTTHVDAGFGGYDYEEHTFPESDTQYTVRVCFDDINSVIEFTSSPD
jgi:hypothetical protein